MLRSFSTKRIVAFFLFDWLGTLLVLGLSSLLLERPVSLALALLVALLWPLSFLLLSVYDGRRCHSRLAELRQVALALTLAGLVLAGSLFLFARLTSRLLFLTFLALDLALLLGARLALWAYRGLKEGPASGRRRVLVVGAGTVGCHAVVQLAKHAPASIELLGYADDDPAKQGRRFEGLPVLATLDDLAALVRDQRVDDALVALPLWAHDRLLSACRALQALGVHVHVVPDLFALSFPSATLDGFGGIPVVDLGQPGVHGWQRLCKRVFDLAVAALLLALLSPLLALTALLVRLESPGPALYRQERIGENGRPFTMLKFRSMRDGVDVRQHQEHVARLIRENTGLDDLQGTGPRSLKMEADPRITRVGHVIRKTSIDELPQLINVLHGEMSLVGPRPPLPYEVALYQDWHKRRLAAIPGITGWWQVKGRNRVSFDEMVRMDLHYIERSCFWLDLKILLLTPWAALSGRGAG
jgi:exopolysaccharide biosynthesis polyprenyl glycosylphosphotransferase